MLMKRMTMTHNLKVHTLATRALVSYPGSGNTWIRYLIGNIVTMIKGKNDCENHDHHDNHDLDHQRGPPDFTRGAFSMTRAF